MAPLGANPSAGATPSAVGGEDGEARTSPTQPPLRGQLGHPGEESAPVAPLDLESTMPDAAAVAAKAQEVPSCQAVVTLPSFLPAPQVLVSSAPSAAVLD